MSDLIQIKKYVEDNRPDLLIKALNSTLPQVIKSFDPNEKGSCITTQSHILKQTLCYEVKCRECPFDRSIEEAKNWLRQ